jgi:hypothetical protein
MSVRKQWRIDRLYRVFNKEWKNWCKKEENQRADVEFVKTWKRFYSAEQVTGTATGASFSVACNISKHSKPLSDS